MKHQEMLEKYAKLLVNFGLAIKPGDSLVIRFDQEGLPLARLCQRYAYEAGAKDIELKFSDPEMTLNFYNYASPEALEYAPSYRVEYMEKMYLDKHHLLSIGTPNPTLLKEVDPKKIATVQRALSVANKPLDKYVMENRVKWLGACNVGKAWAKLVFPDLPEEEAIEKLWEKVFFATRVDLEDPIEAWKEHDRKLKEHENYLNEARFEKLLYKGPGTDLEVYLVEGHAWVGGSSVSPDGELFMANIPTEEVFTMPHRDKVNGTIRATMPLSVRGTVVDGFSFTLKDGKIVDYSAKEGYETLKGLLETDEGALHFGEVALVSHNSPISNTGVLFRNTLFDENASCHFALGAAYGENLPGSTERSDEENLKLGMNDSLIHVDFMVGSKELEVIGVKKNGEQVVLLKDGDWRI
ncbi:aminopeptidase [Guggenheimella bovis]